MDATPEHPIDPLLARRWSPRAFLAEPPTRAELGSLFSAAAWSASAGNGQPWRFVVGVRGDEVWPRVLATLNERNQIWAAGAPVLGITIAQTLRDDKPLATGAYDLGQAMAHLSIEASALGISVHQMGGFSADAARESFLIPAGFAAWTAFAIGRLGDPASLPDDLRAREGGPRHRRPLAETVFGNAFGTPFGV
jgi:nitroreductase